MSTQKPKPSSPGTAFQQWLGLRWSRTVTGDPAETGVAVELDLRPDLCGPAGTLEGGVISTLVDMAGASACALALGSGLVATEHIAVSMLAPGRVGPICSTGTVLRQGRHDAVAQVHVVDRGRDERLMAVALVTVRRLAPVSG